MPNPKRRHSHQRTALRRTNYIAIMPEIQLNKQIGGELSIGEVTVKVHCGRVMKKMPAETWVDLVTMVAKMNRAGQYQGPNDLA